MNIQSFILKKENGAKNFCTYLTNYQWRSFQSYSTNDKKNKHRQKTVP